MPWIDVHTHLDKLDISPEQALADAAAVGVERMITIGTEAQDHAVVLELARKYYPKVMCTLGIHPHEGVTYSDEIDAFIRKHAPEKEVAAIGEIGLDYHYNHSPKEQQKDAFRRQLQIAKDLSLPIEIHTRDADEDTVSVLREFGGAIRGIVHCFTGTQWLADQAIELGLDISISGVVTFKKADELRDVVRSIPLSRLHVETDAPFLAPLPHRGKKNVPAYVLNTAQVVAGLKGVTLDELQAVTWSNAQRTFPKLNL